MAEHLGIKTKYPALVIFQSFAKEIVLSGDNNHPGTVPLGNEWEEAIEAASQSA